MRKWMSDRLQRRKKKPAEPSDQPAPPPLQPAYFEAEQEPAPAPGAGHMETEISEPLPSVSDSPALQKESTQSEDEASEAQPAGSQPATRGSSQSGRGRRRRGGRGRGGRGREQAVAQAFTPAAVKGSIPGVPVDTGEEEFSDAGETEGPAPGQRSGPARIAPPPRAPAAAAAQTAPKGIVVLAIGLPGSGKSSWFKRHNVVPLSSDLVRSLLFDDVREQRFQDLVFSNLRSMLKARLIAKRPTNYVDATNLTPQERQHWIKLAKDYHYEVHAVFFDVPLDVCIERHERRDRVVPEDVMRRMAAKLKPPAFEEGFAKITVVRVKKKETGEA
ncbi:MAG: hypothetical protein QOF56_4321 [Acidobacteriaceae bacterium]|nr:hypothetical protein [Acidobacteriaceae bacterium]